MTKQSSNSSIESIVHKVDTESVNAVYGLIISPHQHSTCWCIKPSDIYLKDEIIENLKASEAEYLKQGKQLWIVRFEEDDLVALNPFSFLLTDAGLESPTAEQLSRLESFNASVNYGIVLAKEHFLEDY
ncbi:hypothetical protein MCEKH45_01359 [Methylophilaceae bacterium]|jgi:hypothetical protein